MSEVEREEREREEEAQREREERVRRDIRRVRARVAEREETDEFVRRLGFEELLDD
jgi:hypothetical protein